MISIRVGDAEWRLSGRNLLFGLASVMFIFLGGCMERARSTGDILRVRGLVIEDEAGRPRIVLGAPLGSAANRDIGGTGIAVLSPEGHLRVAVGAPTPNPTVEGETVERIGGGAAGLIFFDPEGNERGGLGAFDDGRANMCLDYARGVKEAVCMFVFPQDQYAGILVNGHPDHGYERANLIVGADGLARMKISAIDGSERALLQTDGTGPAELLVYDEATGEYVDVMPPP